MSPDVSVIIPCAKEHIPTLQRAVDSAYEAGAFEVVVVYDGIPFREIPAFKTPKHYPYHYDYLPYVSGVVSARNLAIHNTKSELILPLDADDTLLPKSVEALVNVWEPRTVVYGDWIEYIDVTMSNLSYEQMQVVTHWNPEEQGIYPHQVHHAAPPGMVNRKSVTHATYLFARSDWQKVGGYDADFNVGAEDHCFMLDLTVNGGCRLIHVDAPIYRRSINENGRSGKAYKNRGIIRELLKAKFGDAFNG